MIFVLYNSDVSASVKIGKGTVFGHGGIGVVVHEKAVIGENCVVGQGITIGGKSRAVEVPVIGDYVYMAAGCRIIGPITIGNNVVIGANAVVTKSIPDNSLVAGIPAKIIKENIRFEDYV
jgi:serine O-acetyltransferase